MLQVSELFDPPTYILVELSLYIHRALTVQHMFRLPPTYLPCFAWLQRTSDLHVNYIRAGTSEKGAFLK